MTRSYMFNDRNTGAQRRIREDQQVELRRQKTEELLNKKRASAQASTVTASFASIRERLDEADLEAVYKAMYECRNMLSVESDPPIQAVINSGVIPRVVELLDIASYGRYQGVLSGLVNKTRIEAAWVITNVVSGTSEQTDYVVRQGAIRPLVEMFSEDDDGIIDQSVWALGNLAGDCEAIRNMIIGQGALPRILELVEKYSVAKEHIRILRNLTWLMANLCRGRNPPPTVEVLAAIQASVERLIMISDCEIVSDCLWCLSYIVDINENLTNRVLESPVMRRCHELLSNFALQLKSAEDPSIAFDSGLAKVGAFTICPMIRMIGNIISGTDLATDAVIRAGFLSFLSTVFYKYQNKKLPRIRKEICWLLSNVAAGTPDQICYILGSDLANLLIDAITRYELYIRKEASFAIMNILHFCASQPQHLQPLLDNQIIQALQSHLAAIPNIPELQAHILDAARYALEAGEKIRAKFGENPVVQIMIDCGIVDEIEDLQEVHSPAVSQKAYNIIIDFFDGVDEQ